MRSDREYARTQDLKWDKSERLRMDSRVVEQIEEFYRHDAKFTERAVQCGIKHHYWMLWSKIPFRPSRSLTPLLSQLRLSELQLPPTTTYFGSSRRVFLKEEEFEREIGGNPCGLSANLASWQQNSSTCRKQVHHPGIHQEPI
jgi:hypothetical protein